MPHYPDEIEYSDKYVDDYYEYRHVILPKEVYKKMARGRLLVENVLIPSRRNGGLWEFSNLEDGCTTSSIAPNPTYFCSGEPKELIHKPVSHQLVSSRHLTPLLIDLNKCLIN